MKKFISALLLIAPAMSFAAAKTIRLPLIDQSKGDSKYCIYADDLSVGHAQTIKPFQIMVELEDGSLALNNNHTIHRTKSGEFIVRAGTARTVPAHQACPATAEITLIQ